jgi:hypothetical protein
MTDIARFLIGIVGIMVILGSYQTIYLLNKHLSSKLIDGKRREIESDIKRYGTCCGNTESCTLEAKINDLKKQVELSLPETIVEIKGNAEDSEIKTKE